MSEDLSTIKKKLIGCSVFLAFAAALSFVALAWPDISPARDTFGAWFQRSGSVMVIAAIWVEFILLKISPFIDPSESAYAVPFEVPPVYRRWFRGLSGAAVVFALLGTVIWGYGDLFFPEGSNGNGLEFSFSSLPLAEVSSALLTPVIAFLAAYIAWRQWKTAQNRLKLDLFERRFSVYDATKGLIASIMQTGKATDENMFKFLAATKEAKWLFDDQIASYLDEKVWEKTVDLQTLNSELEGLPKGPDRTENIHKQRDIKLWLNSQLKEIDRLFSKFLRIEH